MKTCGITNVLLCHIVSKSKKLNCQKAVKKFVKKLLKSCQKVVKKLSKKLSKSCQKLSKVVKKYHWLFYVSREAI
jgi:hypothetical protein